MKDLYHVSCFVSTNTKITGYSDFLMELTDPRTEGWLDRVRIDLANVIALRNSLEFFDPKYVSIISISKL